MTRTRLKVKRKGRNASFTAALSFVVKPPRLLPSASEPPFFFGAPAAEECARTIVESIGEFTRLMEMFMEFFKDLGIAPSAETSIDGIPIAETLGSARQVAPSFVIQVSAERKRLQSSGFPT